MKSARSFSGSFHSGAFHAPLLSPNKFGAYLIASLLAKTSGIERQRTLARFEKGIFTKPRVLPQLDLFVAKIFEGA